jgi:hypothetical protein
MSTVIRDISGNIISRFENLRDNNPEMHRRMEAAGQISKKILMEENLRIFEGPKAIFGLERTIKLNEAYMNYLWAIGYYFFVLEEEINQREIDKNWNGELVINTVVLQNAFSLFNWAIGSKVNFNPIPDNLPQPTPRKGLSSIEIENCGHANSIFTFAISFLMYHEFAHLVLRHDDSASLYDERLRRKLTEEECLIIKATENEADVFALEMLFKEYDDEKFKINAALGITVAIISILFLEESVYRVQKTYHPDTDERIKRAIEYMRFDDKKHSDYIYQLICNACILFFNKIDVQWNDFEFETIEELFSKIMSEFDKYKE